VLQAPAVNDLGFVVDYGELKPLKDYIDTALDHWHLNDVLAIQPSAENLARHLYDFCKARWPQTVAVRVSETPKTWATYSEAAGV
jgi:6-pyruvoyltetrahydropterin/6-carboxytetrahydropterin synthase